MADADRSRCIALGLLTVLFTVLGLVAMSQFGGMGSLAFSLYAPLWVIFGVGVAVDCFRSTSRRTSR